jgi:hypothetical protein
MLDLTTTHNIDEGMNSTAQVVLSARESTPGEHYALKKGDLDPQLNKIIEEVVLNTNEFIVYVADDCSVQWRTTDDHTPSDHCGEVLNQVSLLEAQSKFITDKHILCSIRCQIAEGLARCFSGQDREYSLAIFREIEAQLRARNKETSWKWYFESAYFVTLACIVSFGLLWLFRDAAKYVVGVTAYEVVLGSLCGAIGALLSVTVRGNRLVLDANAGKAIHQLEGLSRVGAGLIGALFVSLGIKSGLIMGGANFSGNKLSLLLVFCIIAGASERLVPSLVESFEKAALPIGEKEQD